MRPALLAASAAILLLLAYLILGPGRGPPPPAAEVSPGEREEPGRLPRPARGPAARVTRLRVVVEQAPGARARGGVEVYLLEEQELIGSSVAQRRCGPGSGCVGRWIDEPASELALARWAAEQTPEPAVHAVAATDGQGVALFTGLAPGRYAAWAQVLGGRARSPLFALAAGEERELVLSCGPEARLEGAVLTLPGSRHLAGARVQAFDGELGLPVETQTDRTGRFSLPAVLGETYLVVASAPGFAPSAITGVEAGEELELELLRPAVLLVSVREGGAPAAGARVELSFADAWEAQDTDAQGQARFTGLGPDQVKVQARRGERLYGELAVELDPGAERRVEISLTPHVPLRVEAWTAAGQPAAEALVELNTADPRRALERDLLQMQEGDAVGGPAGGTFLHTGSDGHARLLAPGPGRYTLRVSHQEHGVVEQALEIGPTDPELTRAVRFPADATLRGRVRDSRGRPLDWLLISARSGEERRLADTDDQGRFVLAALRPGAWDLTVERDGRRALARQVIMTAASQELELVLEGGLSIRGQVLDPQDRPVEGAWVRAQRVPREEADRGPGYSAEAGPDGSFEIDALDAGEYALVVELPGVRRAGGAPARAQAGATGVVLRTAGSATVEGEVTFAGPPPDRYTLRAGSTLAELPGHQISFRLELPAGQQDLHAFAPGYRSQRHSLDLRPNATRPLRVTFRPSRSLSGRVVSRGDRRPLADVALALRAGPDLPLRHGLSDAQGRFVFPEVEADQVQLRAQAPGFAPGWFGPFRPEEAQEIEIELAPATP